MYEKNKTQRITLRLSEELFNFTKDNAENIGVSPSEFIRMMLNSIMIQSNKTKQILAENTLKVGVGRENDKTNLNNIV